MRKKRRLRESYMVKYRDIDPRNDGSWISRSLNLADNREFVPIETRLGEQSWIYVSYCRLCQVWHRALWRTRDATSCETFWSEKKRRVGIQFSVTPKGAV